MSIQRLIVLIFGVVYVLVGVMGFIPGVRTGTDPFGEGDLLGIFPVNLLHSVVHLIIGVALLYGSTSTAAAVSVARGVGVVFLLIGILGFVSPDTFGLMPIGGNDIWLHLASGAVLLVVGFLLPADREARTA